MQNEQIGVVDEGVKQQVRQLLDELRKGADQRIGTLRKLFHEQLNYEYTDKPLALADSLGALLVGNAPLLFATGADGEFHVIYMRFTGNTLSLSDERKIIIRLLNNHPYALFIFSNHAQTTWHFVNVKYETDNTKRRLFRRITVEREDRLRTAVERLSMLDVKRLASHLVLMPLDIQQMHDDAFDVEAVTKRFFGEYRAVFGILQQYLQKQTGDPTWAHDYALQFLNRCMFLYFIQRKHWLGDDSEFLNYFWQSYLKTEHEPNTFVKNWLMVLFFQAFNDGYTSHYRYFPDDIHTVLSLAPFLNGGLFTENALDREKSGEFVISDERFLQVLLFLEAYNFTITEDSPLDQEVAVDPEMIGKVYESLVNVSEDLDERSDAGIFYTPRVEIDLMCRLSLVEYLTNHLGSHNRSYLYDAVFAMEPEDKETADTVLKQRNIWRPLYDLLEKVTVVDPACGSGAFLVGMLYVLDDLMERAEKYLPLQAIDKRERAYLRKKSIIGRSLYGVDVMEWAVRVAELRLWLALIVDVSLSREELHVRNEPLLPYFTFKVQRGDSLVQRVGNIDFGHNRSQNLTPTLKRRITQLKQQKLLYYNNDPLRKEKDELQYDERRLFIDILQERLESLERSLQAVSTQQHSMLGMDAGNGGKAALEKEQQVAQLEEQRQQLLEAIEAIHTANVTPFVWDIAFVEVFTDKDGFDLVIGNPPYVRQEQIVNPLLPVETRGTKEKKQEYKQQLAQAVSALFPRFFAQHEIGGKSDLYIYFYLYGLWLLNAKGTFSFITSNSWLDVGYGAILQEFLLKHCHIKLILDNEMRRSFSNASVNTVITLFSAPDESNDGSLDETARFVMCRVPFEQLLSAELMKTLVAAQQRQSLPAYRIHPIKQRTLFEEGMAQPEAEDEEADEVPAAPTPPRRKGRVRETPPSNVRPLVQTRYTGNKWGGKYLRAPDIYWTIIEKGKDKLVRLGDIAEVRRGITTGANEFFYLDKKAIKERGIEPEFLRPVIKSPRECKSISINDSALKFSIFLCNKTKEELQGTAALEYIEWGEKQGYQRRPSCASRPRWWDLGIRRTPYLGFNYLIDSTARTLYAPNGCYFSDNFQEVNVDSSAALPLCASLNSTVFQLMVNVAGRANFGDGLLKIQTYEVSDLLCVNPRNIVFQDYTLLSSTSWDVLNSSIERKMLDELVFDLLNLTQGERDAVYEAVTYLVNKRLQKAGSLGEQAQRKAVRKRLEAVKSLAGIWMGLPEDPEEDML